VRRHCALWASRILARYPRLDRETIAFTLALAGPTHAAIQRCLGRLIPAGLGIDAEEVLTETGFCPDDLGFNLARRFVSAPRRDRNQTAREVSFFLYELAGRGQPACSCPLGKGLRKVASTYGLDQDEVDLAFFLAVIANWSFAEDFLDRHLHCDRPAGRKFLITALGFTHAQMCSALKGKLSRIGILDNSHAWLSLDSDFVSLFSDPASAPMLRDIYRPVPPPDLTPAELGVPDEDLGILRLLLASEVACPVHVLVHGPPGTGKTTLVQGLVQEMDKVGVEVMGRAGNSLKERRAALEACLHISSGRPGKLVVVDEADNLLASDRPWLLTGDTVDKAWLNSVLERPGIRAVWVVNRTDGIDPAVSRRFAFSLEMQGPDERGRTKILERALRRHHIKRHFREEHIRALVRENPVSPAQLEAAVQTAALAAESAPDCHQTLSKVLTAARSRLGDGPRKERLPRRPTLIRQGLNLDLDLASLESQVQNYDARWREAGNGSGLPPLHLLFHGPSGTGKSVTARHLAALIDRPAIIRRGSDLFDPFFGVTERRIAAAFAEAAREGGILVMDEIDSLLFSRRHAHRNFEVQHTNEVLARMEEGPGILIGTTNRLDALDEAVMRRFLLKVEFGYLPRGELVRTYEEVIAPVARGGLSGIQKARLGTLRRLTTADLCLVRDRVLLLGAGKVEHGWILGELEREVGSKEKQEGAKVTGFQPGRAN